MKNQSIFLLSRSIEVVSNGPEIEYSKEISLNVLSKDGVTPVVSAGVNAPTHSKTYSAPGDDDPDPGQIRCY